VELIEVTDVAVDASTMELRRGDRVQLHMVDEPVYGEVIEVRPSEGPVAEQLTEEGLQVTATVPPVVLVLLDSGPIIECRTQFLRTPVWRWHANELKRLAHDQPAPPRPSAQGA
jgi:hypothetical protein